MRVTELKECSAYQAYLLMGLYDAVAEYEWAHESVEQRPSLTEDTATPELTVLHYTLEHKQATTLLLAAACVEAIANLYLSLKTSSDQFAVLERATFLEKWSVVPSFVIPGYTLPKNCELYQDVRRLQTRRNALMHLKEKVMDDGVVVHAGSMPEHAGDEHCFVKRCRSLPDRLVSHLASFDKTDAIIPLRGNIVLASTFLEIRRSLTTPSDSPAH